jgi:hypothetical protein
MSAMTKREMFIRIKNEYRKAHNNEPAGTRAMLDWGKENGLYAVDQSAAMRKDAEDFADVLRTETVKDNDGQDARINHAYVTRQGHFWDEYRTIAHEHMQLSSAQGRNRIFGEVKHQARGEKLYSDYHQDRPAIRTPFDFTNDLAEAGLASSASSEIDQLVEQSLPSRKKKGSSL